MELFDRFASLFDDWNRSSSGSGIDGAGAINPATGLPMTGGVDVAGNPYGIDLSRHHDHGCSGDDVHQERSSLFEHANWHDNGSSGTMEGGHDPWRD